MWHIPSNTKSYYTIAELKVLFSDIDVVSDVQRRVKLIFARRGYQEDDINDLLSEAKTRLLEGKRHLPKGTTFFDTNHLVRHLHMLCRGILWDSRNSSVPVIDKDRSERIGSTILSFPEKYITELLRLFEADKDMHIVASDLLNCIKNDESVSSEFFIRRSGLSRTQYYRKLQEVSKILKENVAGLFSTTNEGNDNE